MQSCSFPPKLYQISYRRRPCGACCGVIGTCIVFDLALTCIFTTDNNLYGAGGMYEDVVANKGIDHLLGILWLWILCYCFRSTSRSTSSHPSHPRQQSSESSSIAMRQHCMCYGANKCQSFKPATLPCHARFPDLSIWWFLLFGYHRTTCFLGKEWRWLFVPPSPAKRTLLANKISEIYCLCYLLESLIKRGE